MTSGEASESGSIVTVPRCVEQKGRNGTWRVLAKLSVSSEPGNERLAMERVAEVVKELGLSKERTLTRQARSPNERLAGVRLARGEKNRKGYEWFTKCSFR